MNIKITKARVIGENESGDVIAEATFKEIQRRGGVPISSCSYGAKWLGENHL